MMILWKGIKNTISHILTEDVKKKAIRRILKECEVRYASDNYYEVISGRAWLRFIRGKTPWNHWVLTSGILNNVGIQTLSYGDRQLITRLAKKSLRAKAAQVDEKERLRQRKIAARAFGLIAHDPTIGTKDPIQ